MLAITLSVTFLSTMQLLGPPTYKATLLGETTPKTLKLFSPSARYTQGELVVGPLPGKNPFRLQVFKVRHAPGRNQVLEVTDATLEIVDDENSFRDKNASLWDDLTKTAESYGLDITTIDPTHSLALADLKKLVDAKEFNCQHAEVPAKWAALRAEAKKLGVYVYPNDETAQAALDRVKKTKEKRTADATAFRCDEEEVSSKWAALTAEAKKLGVYVYPSYETPQAALDRIQKTRAKRPADATAFKCSPKEVPAKAEDAKASWTWKQIISFNVATIVLANVFENMLEGWKDPIRDGKDKRTAKEKARDMAKALINWQMYKANFVQLGRVFAPAKPAEGKTTPSFGKRAVTFAKHKPFIAAGAGVFVAGNVYMAATGLTAKNFKAKYFPVKAA